MAFKAFKARKLDVLTENETVSSVNSWQQNMEFHLASCNEFSIFLDPNCTWVNPLNFAHVASVTHDPQELIERGIVDSFFCFQSTHYPQDPYCPSMSQAPKPKA